MEQERFDELAAIWCRLSVILSEVDYRRRPILGGPFGSSGYVLASSVSITGGLHEAHYYVIHTDSLAVVGLGDSKAEAMAEARELLGHLSTTQREVAFSKVKAAVAQHRAEERIQAERSRAAHIAAVRASLPPKEARIPKRRQQVFDKSSGKCHYCGTALTLDGKWHIEHKMPRALLGSNEMGNLVASCVPCNMRKKDRTDLEFMAAEGRA